LFAYGEPLLCESYAPVCGGCSRDASGIVKSYRLDQP
jgi:hypothetical protein